MDGFLWLGKCSGTVSASLDCTINNDQNTCAPSSNPYATRGALRTTTHNVGGTAGTKYTINFEVRGVAGGKYYTTGMQRTSTGFSEADTAMNDGWYEGGTPTESLWNTYEIHVDPPVTGAANIYYLNGFPSSTGFDGRHETLVMKFTASFPVMGGGTIKMILHDSNCRGQQNCGQTVEGQTTCTSPRTVSLDGMTPQLTQTAATAAGIASLTQPFTQDGFHPQWLYFDVKTVTSP
jgi:hypothetical protein